MEMSYEDEMDAIAAEFRSGELVGGDAADESVGARTFDLAEQYVCKTHANSLSEGALSLAGVVDESRRRRSRIDPMSRTPIRVNE